MAKMKRIVPLTLIIFASGVLGPLVFPGWAGDDIRDIIISRALDVSEPMSTGDAPSPVTSSERAESLPTEMVVAPEPTIVDQPAEVRQTAADAKQAYLSGQSKYYYSAPVDKRHSFDAGYEMYSYNYHETVNSEKFVTAQGNYQGFFVDYAFRPVVSDEDDFTPDEYRIQARKAFASNIEYAGSGTFSGLKDSTFEMRGLIGKRFNLWNALVSAPYLGLGYRYLFDGASALPARDGYYSGYDRENRMWYLPLGADFRTVLRGGWGLDINLEYERLIRGEQVSHLEDMRNESGVNAGYSKLTNTQKGGFGLRGSVKLAKNVKPGLSFFVEPFYRYWKLGNSDVQVYVQDGEALCNGSGLCWGGYEPENWTQEVGMKLGVGF